MSIRCRLGGRRREFGGAGAPGLSRGERWLDRPAETRRRLRVEGSMVSIPLDHPCCGPVAGMVRPSGSHRAFTRIRKSPSSNAWQSLARSGSSAPSRCLLRRAAVRSQAAGRSGMPSCGQCSQALTRASETNSSARSKSPRQRSRLAVSRRASSWTTLSSSAFDSHPSPPALARSPALRRVQRSITGPDSTLEHVMRWGRWSTRRTPAGPYHIFRRRPCRTWLSEARRVSGRRRGRQHQLWR